MKKIILILISFIIYTSFISLYAQWARTYGGSDYEWSLSNKKASDNWVYCGGLRE